MSVTEGEVKSQNFLILDNGLGFHAQNPVFKGGINPPLRFCRRAFREQQQNVVQNILVSVRRGIIRQFI